MTTTTMTDAYERSIGGAITTALYIAGVENKCKSCGSMGRLGAHPQIFQTIAGWHFLVTCHSCGYEETYDVLFLFRRVVAEAFKLHREAKERPADDVVKLPVDLVWRLHSALLPLAKKDKDDPDRDEARYLRQKLQDAINAMSESKQS